jgi:hypothetical protein
VPAARDSFSADVKEQTLIASPGRAREDFRHFSFASLFFAGRSP